MFQYSKDDIEVCCYWYDRPMVAGEFARWVFGLLRRLKLIDESFSKLYLVERYGDGFRSTDVSEDAFEELIFANLQKDLACTNPLPSETELTRDSCCALGFSTSFVTSEQPNASSSIVEIRIGKSLANSVNTLVIRSSKSHPGEYFAKLLGMLVEYTKPCHAQCWSHALSERINQPVGDIYVGWSTYLADESASKPLNDMAVVMPLGEGVVIEAADLQDFSLSEQVIAKVLAVIDRLGGMGFLANPRRRNA